MEELPTRWEVELEFVQSLANIQYVSYLAQNEYLSDPAFIAYLKYLNYWRDAKYAKFLVYPNCLHILTLLQTESFRKNIIVPEFMNSLMNDMVQKWQGHGPEGSEEQTENGAEPKSENGNGATVDQTEAESAK